MPDFLIRLPGLGGVVAGGAGESNATPSFSYHDGPIFDHAQLHLVFWGTAWAAGPTPSVDAVTGAVQSILASTFMSTLAQYRNIAGATLQGTSLATDSDPPDPFSDDHVTRFIQGLMQEGKVPEPDEVSQLVYCVFMPPGVSHSDQSVIGEHNFFWYWDREAPLGFDVDKAYYAWVTNDGTLDKVTTIFSHELVEVVSDPEGSGITGAPCSAPGWCEIGDVCQSSNGRVNDIAVQGYWSEQDQGCVIPGSP